MVTHDEVAGAPEGVTFRGLDTERDFPEMTRVINAVAEADAWDVRRSESSIASWYRNIPNCDVARDVTIAEAGGEMVAYGRVHWREEIDGSGRRYDCMCFVHPAWRRRGLGEAMWHWNEARAAEIAAEGGAPATFIDTYTVESDIGGSTLARALGYRPYMYDVHMIRPTLDDIPEAELPDGLVVRPPREDEMRKVWDADIEAFRDHVGFTETTEDDFRSFMEDPHRDPSLWRIAWDGDEIAGQVRSFIQEDENREMGRKRGYTEDISTRKPWRRRGIARALLVQSLHALEERGMEQAALGVHVDNPRGAFDLYQSVGFRPVVKWTTWHKPMG